MHTGVFPLTFFFNVLGKTKPNSQIHSAGTHRNLLKRMREGSLEKEAWFIFHFHFNSSFKINKCKLKEISNSSSAFIPEGLNDWF